MTTTHRITTAAVILSLAAVGAPAASAKPADFVPSGERAPAAVYSRPDKSMILMATPHTAPVAEGPSAPHAVVRIATPASGFDWGDAGIGAAGGLALAMLGVGGGLVLSNHRPRRSRRTTALPS